MFPPSNGEFAMLLALAGALALAAAIFALRPRFRYSPYRFEFWDGAGLCEIDTLTVLNRLEAQAGFRVYDHPRLAAGGNRAALKITGRAVRAIFEAPYLSDDDALKLLIGFMQYAGAMKKRMGLAPV